MNKSKYKRRNVRACFPLLLMALLFFFAACASTHREKMLEESLEAEENGLLYEELQARFMAEQPTAEELKAFEVRAIQKLKDFYDYLNLLHQPSLDSVFQQHAERQLKSLFVDSTVSITVGEQDSQRLQDLLNELKEGVPTTEIYSLQNVEVAEALHAFEANQYIGTLSFEQIIDHENTTSQARQAHFVVKKVPKQFGQEQEWIWEVLLSGIE
ncbi:hypothetical protein WJR50_22545 [Catalinimonas sp. 4WD22]|uniref:hypothetical protein n=1 Tax=Catalinimonas locisalis TaxID=3133978 RepID=UPI0031019967